MDFWRARHRFTAPMEIISSPRSMERGGRIIEMLRNQQTLERRPTPRGCSASGRPSKIQTRFAGQLRRMIETSGVIEKEQGNGFYLVTLEQPAGHQCLCRAAGKLTKFRIKLLAGDKVLVEISPYDLTRGRITYRERNAGAPGGRPGGNRPGGPRRR